MSRIYMGIETNKKKQIQPREYMYNELFVPVYRKQRLQKCRYTQ